MKKYLLIRFSKLLIVCASLLAFGGCEKESVPADGIMAESVRSSRLAVCTGFTYADSIFYLREQLTDYIVSPVEAQAGTYGASPWGLAINPGTGAINVSKSETGLTYSVFFIKAGTTDTCTRAVTISGIDFASSIHVLSQNDTSVKPIYRGLSSDPAKLSFDIGGLNGLIDAPLRSLGIAINQQNAIIDLKKTVLNGVFGLIPINGKSVTVRLYYTIDDASKKARNHIDLRLTYYSKLSDVPASMLSKVKSQNARVSSSAESSVGRPPEIIIVG